MPSCGVVCVFGFCEVPFVFAEVWVVGWVDEGEFVLSEVDFSEVSACADFTIFEDCPQGDDVDAAWDFDANQNVMVNNFGHYVCRVNSW